MSEGEEIMKAGEDPLARRKAEDSVLKAMEKWGELSPEERVRVAQTANELNPGAVVDWEYEAEQLKSGNQYLFPSAVHAVRGGRSTEEIVPFLNEALPKVLEQKGSALDLDKFQYEGKDVTLDEETLRKIQEFRRDRN